MSLLGKLQPLIIIASAVLGVLLGNTTALGNISSIWIEIFLMMLLYVLFLCVDLKEIRRSVTNLRYTAASVGINFIVTPVLAFVLGKIFFPESTDIRIGLLMLLVTPCTDWYLVFTRLGKGNVELNLSILPLNLVLQILLMPVYLLVFMGSEVNMDPWLLVGSVVRVLMIPFLVALLTKVCTRRMEWFQTFISEQCDNLQLLFLCIAVVMMFASEGQSLTDNPMLLIRMFLPLLIFFVFVFVLAQAVGRLLKFPKEDLFALNFTTMARNSPLSLAIAVATFPEHPMIALALVVGPLIELPILSITAGITARMK